MLYFSIFKNVKISTRKIVDHIPNYNEEIIIMQPKINEILSL